jgi:hypothetical protein
MFQIVPYTDEVVVNSLDCFQVNGTSDMQVSITLSYTVKFVGAREIFSSGRHKVLQYIHVKSVYIIRGVIFLL